MSIARCRLILLTASAILCASQAAADPILIPTYVPANPAADAADLAGLAPPSNRATARLTYGDATIGRRHTRRKSHGRDPRYACIDLTSPSDRCPPQTAPASDTFHVITPSYVSAPEVVGAPPGRPSPLRSPFVGFVLDTYAGANALLPTPR